MKATVSDAADVIPFKCVLRTAGHRGVPGPPLTVSL